MFSVLSIPFWQFRLVGQTVGQSRKQRKVEEMKNPRKPHGSGDFCGCIGGRSLPYGNLLKVSLREPFGFDRLLRKLMARHTPASPRYRSRRYSLKTPHRGVFFTLIPSQVQILPPQNRGNPKVITSLLLLIFSRSGSVCGSAENVGHFSGSEFGTQKTRKVESCSALEIWVWKNRGSIQIFLSLPICKSIHLSRDF